MRSRLSALLLSIILVFSSQPLPGQTPSQPQDEKIRIGTAEVSLDVVIRDKKGRPVRDLTASDFEIYEDNVRQQIESFRLVSRESGAGAAAERVSGKEGTTPLRRDENATPGVIALVFDRLSPDARGLARRAALSYANEGLAANDYTGVFAIDLSLQTLQPYTDNQELIRQALDQATASSTSTFASNTSRTRNLSNRSAALEREATTSAGAATNAGASRDSAGASAAGTATGLAAAEQMLAQMETRMLETMESLERDHQGFTTINALLSLINSMRTLPGRKTLIFFSEGLAIPPAVQSQFGSVINAANRANVSIYTIDAAGLRVESANAETTREINAMAEKRMQQVHRGRDDGTGGPLTRALERNEDLLRLSPHSGLGQLADQTGGFLIRETNDLGAGLRRIDEDMRVHYLVTYLPKNQEFDGRFRQITVKMARPNLDVQTRKGYYAIEASSAAPALDYEIPALAAMNGARGANPFALRVAGMHFPENKRPGLIPLLAEVPLSSFTFTTDKEKKTYAADFSIIALIRNESRQLVQKLSQHYPLNGPLDKLDAARKGEVLFYREAELPPGRYTIETVAYDAPTGKASVKTSKLEVTAIEQGKIRLSSLMLLKRADRLTAEERKRDNPFHFGEVIVYPNLGEAVHKSAKQLAFFLVAWPAKGSTAKLTLTLELSQNGRRAGQTTAELQAADESGRVKYASALPLDNFQPGRYELKVTVSDGKTSAVRTSQVDIEP
jgi:VWFA-related protein